MDLHDVADIVEEHAIEAHRAIHAGHSETCYKYFKVIMEQIRAYFEQMSPAEVAALAEVTSEKPLETLPEKPDEVPGAEAHPGGIVPFDEVRKQKPALQSETPTR